LNATTITAIGALAAAVVGLIGVLIGQYLTQRRHSEALRQAAELEAQRADKTAELEAQRGDRDALLRYFELVGQLLANPSQSDSLMPVIQAQTLTLLEALEPGHKRILLHFLQELNLLDPEESDLSLQGANLVDANLEDVSGRRVNLEKANLERAHVERANIAEANLAGANLRDANLVEANLAQANLKQADLSGAFLQEMTEEGLTQRQIDEAVGNDATKLPDHLQRPAHWRGGLGEKELEES
jgi:uncharacterized protein YjbI with pentapeptide repeats